LSTRDGSMLQVIRALAGSPDSESPEHKHWYDSEQLFVGWKKMFPVVKKIWSCRPCIHTNHLCISLNLDAPPPPRPWSEPSCKPKRASNGNLCWPSCGSREGESAAPGVSAPLHPTLPTGRYEHIGPCHSSSDLGPLGPFVDWGRSVPLSKSYSIGQTFHFSRPSGTQLPKGSVTPL
jgi:hypothetical protein